MEINIKFVPHWVSKLAAYRRVPVTEVESVMTMADLISYKNAQSIIGHLNSVLGIGLPLEEPIPSLREQLLLDVLGPQRARLLNADQLNVTRHVMQLVPQLTIASSNDDTEIMLIHDVEKSSIEDDLPTTRWVSHVTVRKFLHSLLVTKSSRMTESELFTSKVFNRYLSAELGSTITT